jgi:hypothetical protein
MTDPHSENYTIVHAPGAGQPAFTGPGYDYRPSQSPNDPHEEPFDVIGEGIEPIEGEVAPNIVTGPGPLSRSRGG